MKRVIRADNFNRDYMEEQFVTPSLPDKDAKTIAEIYNRNFSGNTSPHFWQVVDTDYKLQAGFEP